MKVSKEIFDLSQEIFDLFDPSRIKQQELQKAHEGDQGGSKWDRVEKEFEKGEKIEEIEGKDFKQGVKDSVHKMMGCSQDHSAEIDIYSKTYKEKIERIKIMKEQGNLAMTEYNKKNSEEALNKASYYYAQALLTFVYLIPDNDK